MMITRKIDILTEKVDKLNNIVEKIVFKLLNDTTITTEKKDELFKEYEKIVSSVSTVSKNNNAIELFNYEAYIGKP